MKQALRHMTIRAKAAMLLAMVLLTPAITWAQTAAAPQPVLKKAPPVWLGLLVMFLLLAVVMAVSLMPSKRSHQD